MKRLLLCIAALILTACCTFASAEGFNAAGLPITDGKSSFSMLVSDNYTVEDHAEIYDMLEQQTNVHANLNLLPQQTAKERMSVMVNTGDYPDVIAGWILTTQDILDLGMNEGILIPLEELIAKYCPNINEALDKEIKPGVTVRSAMTLPDGHIYTIPNLGTAPQASFKPYVNQSWLDRLGLQMPTTPEELKQVLIAFRDKDANGNGDPNDEIPFCMTPVENNLGTLAGWFGVDATATGAFSYYDIKDGKLRFTANTDEYRKFLEYFHDLYQEKLIDPEIFTQDSETWKAKARQDLYGVTTTYAPFDFIPDFTKQANPEEYAKYGESIFHPLPVLKGCDKPVYHRNSDKVALTRTLAALTDKCDEKQAAIILRWFDNLFEEENSIQSDQGKLGVTIEKIGDHLYRQLDQTDWPAEKKQKYEWGRIFTQSLPRWFHDAHVIPAGETEVRDSFLDKCDKLYEPYLNTSFPLIWPTSDADSDRLSILTTDINTYVKSMLAQFVSGEKPLNDETWAAYCKQLDNYGLEEMTAINCRILGMEPYVKPEAAPQA